MAERAGDMPRDMQVFITECILLLMAYHYYIIRQNGSGSTTAPVTNAEAFYTAVWPNISV